MRFSFALGSIVLTFVIPPVLHAQYQPPSEHLQITGKAVRTWPRAGGSVIEVEGAGQVELDTATLSADRIVLWISPAPRPPGLVRTDAEAHVDGPVAQHAEISLLGHATVHQKLATRSGDRLFVDAAVRGPIRITADHQTEAADERSPLYLDADELRSTAVAMATPTDDGQSSSGLIADPRRAGNRGTPTTGPTTKKSPASLIFQSRNLETVDTNEGLVAAILTGEVTLLQRRPNGDTIELRADRVVLFTPLKSLRELQKSEQMRRLQDTVTSAYLEGDVRIVFTPQNYKVGEQRLQAERVYYEFATDRAILTDAVIHSVDVQRQIPVIVRAKTVRQLATGEYSMDKAQLTTSAFAVPSYAIAADRMYVRSDEIPGPAGGNRIYFHTNDTTFRVFDKPVFYYPSMSGSITDRGGPLRGIGFENRSEFGFGILTDWGLFESLGVNPPRDLDIGYQLDYFTERGPALGLTGAYRGGTVTDATKQALDFEGDFKGFAVLDHGTDDLGEFRREVDPSSGGDSLRGRFLWEHQHFFPDDWQLQLRVGYVSDATFREEWFRREFEEELPLETSAYIKRQRDTEAFTLLLTAQPSRVVTTADLVQEQFEVERVPEIGYRRIGDSLADDRLTFFSDNTAAGLHFQRSSATLAEQGYTPGTTVVPGIPSLGQTGTVGKPVFRANFRQEVDYPISAGGFKIVPYAMGIFTQYSDSPGNDGEKSRLLGGGGLRLTTEFWKVDPAARSDLFDIHQIRHVIEPELNLFTSVQSIRHDDVFIYDEPIDAVSDVSAVQLALHQRWQTKRGGPGQWRSVDLFTLNVDAEVFDNKPRKQFLNPLNFRGLFFPSLPEASVPRDAINADASWRISDETIVVADASYNMDKRELATGAVGLLVRRGDRLSYYIENRYVDILGSNITSFHMDYQVSSKYAIAVDQSFDFSFGKNVTSGITVARRFDTFVMALSAYEDVITNERGVSFNIYPLGLGQGLSTGAFSGGFHR